MGVLTILLTAILSSLATTYTIDTVRDVKRRVMAGPLGLAFHAVKYLQLTGPANYSTNHGQTKPMITHSSSSTSTTSSPFSSSHVPSSSHASRAPPQSDVFDLGADFLRRQVGTLSRQIAEEKQISSQDLKLQPLLREAMGAVSQLKDYITGDDIRRARDHVQSTVRRLIVQDDEGNTLEEEPLTIERADSASASANPSVQTVRVVQK
jgi:hypothetical protein